MIYKRCGRCGGRVPSGTTCSCKKKNIREYAKATGIKKEYHTQRWKNLRQYVMIKYNGLDIYMLYKYDRIVPADTVHHVELSQDRPDLFYSEHNLIPLSRSAHAEVHERYKKEGKRAVQEELRGLMRRYQMDGDRKKVLVRCLTTTYAPFFLQNSQNDKKVGKARKEGGRWQDQ